jgi:hypothetical protein
MTGCAIQYLGGFTAKEQEMSIKVPLENLGIYALS